MSPKTGKSQRSSEGGAAGGTRRVRRHYRAQILEALAQAQHRGLDRREVIEAVIRNTKPLPEEEDAARAAIAKTLGRLVQGGHVREGIVLSESSTSVNLTNRGYIAINVDIPGIGKAVRTDARKRFVEEKDPTQEERLLEDEVQTQENLIERIARHTLYWKGPGNRVTGYEPDLRKEPSPTASHEAGPESDELRRFERKVVLLDSVIIHSAELDILVTVLYRHQDDFMAYVREVIQTLPHVTGTQTMFVGKKRGDLQSSS